MVHKQKVSAINRLFAAILTMAACNYCAWGQSGNLDLGVIGRWEDTHFPSNATVVALKHSGTALFAGTETGRIYRSGDDGETWSKVLEANPSQALRAPVQDFLFSDSVYLAAAGSEINLESWDCFSPDCVSPVKTGNLYRSTDKGLTWSPTAIKAATALETDGVDLLSAHLQGISRSRDQGRTWTALTLSPYPEMTLKLPGSVAIKSLTWFKGSLYARTSEGLIAGTIKADTVLFKNSLSLAQCESVQGAYLLSSTKTDFYRSRDGQNWERRSQRGFSSIVVSGNKILGLPFESGILQESLDSGKTWTPAAGETAKPITSVCAQGTKLLVGQFQKGVYATKPGNQGWTAAGSGLYDFAVTGLLQRSFLAYTRVALLSSGKMQQAKVHDGGWDEPLVDVGGSIKQVDMVGEDAFGLSDAFILTSLGSRSDVWDTLAPCDGCQGMVVGKGWQAAFQKDNSLLLCEGGSHCEPLPRNRLPEPQSLLSPTASLLNNRFQSACVSDDSIILALDSLYRSSDRGRTWTLLGPLPGTRPLLKYLNKTWFMAVSKDRKAKVLASHDGGLTWQQALPDGSDFEINSMSAIKFAYAVNADGNTIYFGTDKGLQYFSMAESQWKILGPQSATANVTAVSVSNNVLLAGLESGEVMQLYLYVVGVRNPVRNLGSARRPKMIFRAGTVLDQGRLKRLDGRSISAWPP